MVMAVPRWYVTCQPLPTMSKSKPDPWHFARPKLAQQYLQTFRVGLISAQALFAPRRMGKSEFLEQDLIPAAQKSDSLLRT